MKKGPDPMEKLNLLADLMPAALGLVAIFLSLMLLWFCALSITLPQ